jgi:hypothetical protein
LLHPSFHLLSVSFRLRLLKRFWSKKMNEEQSSLPQIRKDEVSFWLGSGKMYWATDIVKPVGGGGGNTLRGDAVAGEWLYIEGYHWKLWREETICEIET